MAMQLVEDREVEVLQPTADRAAGGTGLLVVAWQRRALVLLGLVLGLILGALYYLKREPVYQSVAQVQVSKTRPDLIQLPGTEGPVAMVEDYLTTHTNLIKGEVIQLEAARILSQDPPPGVPEGTDYVYLIGNGLAVTREKDTTTGAVSNILSISFRCPYQEACPKFVAALIDAYRKYVNDRQGQVRDKTVKALEEYLRLVQKDLAGTEQRVRDKAKTRTPLAKERLADHKANLTTYQGKRTQLGMRVKEIKMRLEADTELEKQGVSRASRAAILEGNSANAGKRNPNAEARTLEEQFRTLQLAESELADRVGKDHPDLVSLRKRLALAREMLAKQAGPGGKELDPLDLGLELMRRELAENERQLTDLAKLIAGEMAAAEPLEKEVRGEEADEAQLAHLRKTVEDLSQKLTPLSMTELATRYNIDDVTRPKPAIKVAPSLFQSLLLAGVIGVVFGLGLAYLAEMTDKSFRSPEDIRKRLGLPVIGHIPPFANRPALPEADLDQTIAAYHFPKTLEAESYRGVRTSLYFSAQSQGHKVIQVTSPNAADGKSTLAANLAVSVARSGKRVVLLDADFRKPRVHHLFKLGTGEAGLAQVIAGEAEVDVAMVSCPAVPGLWLMPCGPRPSTPAELLTSPRFQQVLEQLRDRFDLVLVDTPPLLAVSDPSVVAPRVDGVILTIRVVKNGRPAAERAKELLTSLGARVLGVVVNGFAGASTPYGYYSYYQSPYHYEEADAYMKDDGNDDTPPLPPKSR